MEPKVTPEEFKKRMEKFVAMSDKETAHTQADDLMIEILRANGYGEGCDIFRKADLWYA